MRQCNHASKDSLQTFNVTRFITTRSPKTSLRTEIGRRFEFDLDDNSAPSSPRNSPVQHQEPSTILHSPRMDT